MLSCLSIMYIDYVYIEMYQYSHLSVNISAILAISEVLWLCGTCKWLCVFVLLK